MKIVFVRAKSESAVFDQTTGVSQTLEDLSLQALKISSKASKTGSCSKNLIVGLHAAQFVTLCEEWKFWQGPMHEIRLAEPLPVKLFPWHAEGWSEALSAYVQATGQPDVLWVEGSQHPPHMRYIFDLCPDSFKIVYSKDWQPWKVAQLEHYDVCLVDEAWQIAKVKKRCPQIHCLVWQKVIDYTTAFYPIACEKRYDICYVSYLRQRKNHELLFRAMAQLHDRQLTCLCVGADRQQGRAALERIVSNTNLSVHFTGEVPYENVNEYINQCKIGVICAKKDAAPRALLEYMAADVPVLVNAELLAGTRYVGRQAGLVVSPQAFHTGLAELLDTYASYTPRTYYLAHYAYERVLPTFVQQLQDAGCPIGSGV